MIISYRMHTCTNNNIFEPRLTQKEVSRFIKKFGTNEKRLFGLEKYKKLIHISYGFITHDGSECIISKEGEVFLYGTKENDLKKLLSVIVKIREDFHGKLTVEKFTFTPANDSYSYLESHDKHPEIDVKNKNFENQLSDISVKTDRGFLITLLSLLVGIGSLIVTIVLAFKL